MNTDALKKMKLGWLTASAVGVLLAAQGSVAGEGDKAYKDKDQQAKAEQSSEQWQQSSTSFSEVDSNDDGAVEWQDIESEHDQKLQQANWDENQVMNQFDMDDDQSLDEQEYDTFQTALNAQTSDEVATEGFSSGNEEQAQSSEMETDSQQAQAGGAAAGAAGGAAAGAAGQEQYESEQETAQLGEEQEQGFESEQQQGFESDQQTAQSEQGQEQEFEQQAQTEQDQEFEQQAQTEQDQEFQTEQDQEFQTGQGQQFEQEQQTAQTGQNQQIEQGLLNMPVDQVSNAEVVNSRGEEIGTVSRIVRDETTGDLALEVESGGILGLGGSSVLVDLAEVSQMGDNQLLWDTMLSQDEISDIPEHDDSQYSEISEGEYSTLDEATQDQG